MRLLMQDTVMKSAVSVSLGVGASALLAWWVYRKRFPLSTLPSSWEEVGEVEGLIVFPVKSARGVKVSQAHATKHGLVAGTLTDRSFLVVKADGQMVTGRQAGLLCTVEVKMEGSWLILAASGTDDVNVNTDSVLLDKRVIYSKVWGQDVSGLDCGDTVAAWLTQVLYNNQTQVRLIYCGNLKDNRPARRHVLWNFQQYKEHDTLYYADTCAYMLASSSSLSDLNTRLPEAVTMDWFRNNIVVKGTDAYDEDDWAFVKIGPVILRRIKPCERCLLTVVDPMTGIRHPQEEPLTTLKTYRIPHEPPSLAKVWASKPVFGVHMGIDVTGPINVGDKVMVARASKNPQWQFRD